MSPDFDLPLPPADTARMPQHPRPRPADLRAHDLLRAPIRRR